MKFLIAALKAEIYEALALKPLTNDQVMALKELKDALEKVERLGADGK